MNERSILSNFRRSLLMVPTLLGITARLFFYYQSRARKSLLSKRLPQMRMAVAFDGGVSATNISQDSQIEELKNQYGFDQPIFTYSLLLIYGFKDIVTFRILARSFKYRCPSRPFCSKNFRCRSNSGLASTMILIYLISIPLGIAKAVRRRIGHFDIGLEVWALMVLYSVPPLIMGILLLRSYLAGRNFSRGVFPTLASSTPINYASIFRL